MFSAVILDENNYVQYAMQHYDNPQCRDVDEFAKDLEETPKYIKRLLNRYCNGGELRERLIINHLMMFYNVFGVEASTHLLFYKIEEELYPHMKTFLVYLNFYNRKQRIHNVDIERIPLDPKIVRRLREMDEED